MDTDPQILHAERFDEISHLIERDVDRLIGEWLVHAGTEQPDAQAAYRAEMQDRLPSFLRAVAASLRRTDSGERGPHRLLALEHGEQRWNAGWKLSEVVRDYQILRLVLVDHLDASLDRPLQAREVMALGLLLDEAIAAAVVMFVAQQEQMLSQAAREQQQLNQSLASLSAEADASNRAKSEFLANMSHEIRTPMTAILGYVELLRSELQDANQRHAIDTIQRNADFLLEIINDLLDLSKIEARKFDIEAVAVSPSAVLAEVAALMTLRAEAKGIRLATEYRGRIPATIQSDPKRLKQILINLLGNAIKFTDEGEVRTIVSFDTTEPQEEIVFAVTDTGIGMSREDLPRVFQPFLQGHSTASRRVGGTGLGLTISRHLAGLLGGSLAVESQLGSGSTFRLALPTGSLAGVDFIRPAVEEHDGRPQSPKLSLPRLACRVLAADDRRDNQLLIEKILRKSGAQVAIAANGRSAVEQVIQAAAAGEAFDVVLMDMQMPEVDGYEATAQLRAAGYRLPIIALTASAMKGDHERCLQVGCDNYLPKPIDFRLLVEMVARYADSEREP